MEHYNVTTSTEGNLVFEKYKATPKKIKYDSYHIINWWKNVSRIDKSMYISEEYNGIYQCDLAFSQITFLYNKYNKVRRKCVKYDVTDLFLSPYFFKFDKILKKLNYTYNNITYSTERILKYHPNWFEKNILNIKPFEYFDYTTNDLIFTVDVD